MKILKSLTNQDHVEIQEIWLQFWHQVPGFSKKQPAEQWVAAILEWVSRQETRNAST